MKPLLPSLREKKRYLVFEVISQKKLNRMPAEAIKQAMLNLTGELGLAGAGMIFLDKWNTNMQRGLVRINHKYVDKLRASLCFIDKIEDKEVIFKSVGVSGMLKKAEKYLG